MGRVMKNPLGEAWRVIKAWRQSTLGEFHPDLPSPHGPVTEYHGTIDMPGVYREGLRGRPMNRFRAVPPPEGLEGEPVVYTTSEKEHARDWARRKGRTLKVPEEDVGVVGVRGQGLESVEQSDPNSAFSGTTRVHSPGIPRSRLTPIGE